MPKPRAPKASMIGILVPPVIKAAVIARQHQLGFSTISDYLRDLVRRDLAARGWHSDG